LGGAVAGTAAGVIGAIAFGLGPVARLDLGLVVALSVIGAGAGALGAAAIGGGMATAETLAAAHGYEAPVWVWQETRKLHRPWFALPWKGLRAILLLESGSKAPFSGADLGFIAMAFGLIIVALVYTIGKVSGCHINPAVTFALAVTKRFPWSEVPSYWAAQVAGGVAGAFAMWGCFGTRAVDLGYGFGVVHFNGSTTTWGSAMLIEAIGTAILLFTILGIVDTRSPEGWAGLVIGLVVVGIIITVGPVTNASLNPARAIAAPTPAQWLSS